MSLSLLNILCPCAVFRGRVNAQADNLAPALDELGLKPGHDPQFGGAHRREVLRMREKDRPAVADPLAKMNRALRGLSGKIRGRLVDAWYVMSFCLLLSVSFLGSHIEAVHAFFLQETHSRRGFRPYWSPLNRNRIK